MSTSCSPNPSQGLLLAQQHLRREDAEHQAYFCEENIWRWIQRDDVKSLDVLRNLRVVFISGDADAFVMGEQQVGAGERGVVTWDYHVVAAATIDEQWYIFDLDTRLTFPCLATHYFERCFFSTLSQEWQPSFRLLSDEEFLRVFKSDRSHMKDQQGHWQASPPSWTAPSIQGNNILTLANMKEVAPGEVLGLAEAKKYFSKNCIEEAL